MLSRFNTEIRARACVQPRRVFTHTYISHFSRHGHILFMATLFSFARDFNININLILTFQYRFIILLLNIILLGAAFIRH